MERRTTLRLRRHHLPLAAISALLVVLLYITRPYADVLSRASFATAYPATAFLALTLAIGPFNILAGRRNPVSSDLRRDIGIWAGLLGVAHAAIGQCVHLRGKPWLYYIYEHRERHWLPLRHDLFGFANYTGAFSTLLLVVLLATSNDYSLRRLGTPGWKQLQRWNYAVFALAGAHAFLYQAIEKQRPGYVVAIALCVVIATFLQTLGYLRRRCERGES